MSDEENHLESQGNRDSNVAGERDEALKRIEMLYSVAPQKRLARYMSDDTDLWIFQRFDRLHLFSILYLQQKLANLEERLDQVVPEGEWECDLPEFERLMPEIETTLQKYEEALASQARHKAFRKPTERSMGMLGRHCNDNGYRGEYKLCARDKSKRSKYVSIATSDKGWIHKCVDHISFLRSMFATKDSQDMKSSSVLFYSESHVRRAEQAIINIVFCFLLTIPILVLSHVENKTVKLITVLLFILLLSTFTIDLSESISRTGFALVAPYAAILVVFLTTGPGS